MPPDQMRATWKRLTELSRSLGYNTPIAMLIAVDANELQIEKESDASNLPT